MTAATQAARPLDWRGRQIERADQVHAAPFRSRMKTKYRAARTVAELRALAAECRREQNYAAKQANKFANMTRHGTHLYDSWDYLSAAAKDFADQFNAKAARIEAGEDIAVVLPHLAKLAAP